MRYEASPVAASPLPTGRAPRVVMLAPVPPPVTGAAGNNKKIMEVLLASGLDVVNVNTAAPGLSRSAGLAYHRTRLLRNLAALFELVRAHRRGATLYIQPDAGLGAWYTLLHVLLLGWRFPKVMFHHRSFAYITGRSRPMGMMAALTRGKALHVCLSDGMAARFVENYGAVRTLVVTNACFVAKDVLAGGVDAKPATDPHGPIVLGHLSNLRRDKGFFDVADVFERLAEAGLPVELRLAGPITEKEVTPRLEALQARYGDRVSHLGLVSGDVKTNFYRSLDLFLFPTHHPQEAQPNVLFEALAAGVPVIATPRAAIPEMLVGDNGVCSPTEPEFVDFAVAAIRAMSFDANAVVRRRDAILAWMRDEALLSQRQYLDLMGEFGLAAESVKAPWL